MATHSLWHRGQARVLIVVNLSFHVCKTEDTEQIKKDSLAWHTHHTPEAILHYRHC